MVNINELGNEDNARFNAAADALNRAWSNFLDVKSVIQGSMALIEKSEHGSDDALVHAWGLLRQASDLCESFAEKVDEAETCVRKAV